MKHHFLLVVAAVALSGCGQSPRCASNDAESVVAALNAREQFRSMLSMAVNRTQSASMIAERDGSAGRQKLANAIDEAVERHASEWERNLVASWQTLNATEIQLVCEALERSNQTTFMRFASRVAPEAKSRNEMLLRRAGVEVLEASALLP